MFLIFAKLSGVVTEIPGGMGSGIAVVFTGWLMRESQKLARLFLYLLESVSVHHEPPSSHRELPFFFFKLSLLLPVSDFTKLKMCV